MNLKLLSLLVALVTISAQEDAYGRMSDERVIFEIDQGEIEFGFYPELAPVTSAHIFELCTLGLYTGNHIFRVDKNFVAQTADVLRGGPGCWSARMLKGFAPPPSSYSVVHELPENGRNFKFPEQHREVAAKTVPLEVKQGAKHIEGIVSMARGQDPSSGSSSFFFMYSESPHLDMQYAAFGKVTRGMDVLHKLESLPTKTEGIFVMPLQRITILSTRWYRVSDLKVPPQLSFGGAAKASRALSGGGGGSSKCETELEHLQQRFDSQARQLQEVRKKCLPGS